MEKRTLLKYIGGLLTATAGMRVASAAPFPLQKTKAQWREIVSPAAFTVLFEEGTERAGTSPLNAEKRSGTYVCAACNLPLFDAAQKYESNTGWPSFWQPLEAAVATSTDFKMLTRSPSG